METGQSVPKGPPLTCVLKNLKPLSLIELKANHLKQLCTQIWLQYQSDNQDRWPQVSTFDLNILQNLTDILKWNGKWSEVPNAEAFWALWSRPCIGRACSEGPKRLGHMGPLAIPFKEVGEIFENVKVKCADFRPAVLIA